MFIPFSMHEIYVSYFYTHFSFNIRHAVITLMRLSALTNIFLVFKATDQFWVSFRMTFNGRHGLFPGCKDAVV